MTRIDLDELLAARARLQAADEASKPARPTAAPRAPAPVTESADPTLLELLGLWLMLSLLIVLKIVVGLVDAVRLLVTEVSHALDRPAKPKPRSQPRSPRPRRSWYR